MVTNIHSRDATRHEARKGPMQGRSRHQLVSAVYMDEAEFFPADLVIEYSGGVTFLIWFS